MYIYMVILFIAFGNSASGFVLFGARDVPLSHLSFFIWEGGGRLMSAICSKICEDGTPMLYVVPLESKICLTVH